MPAKTAVVLWAVGCSLLLKEGACGEREKAGVCRQLRDYQGANPKCFYVCL